MNPTKNDLSESARSKAVQLLNARLADILDLQSQIKQAHWNVKGPSFIALHELFDEIVERVEDSADTIAERATALGGVALGSSRHVAKSSSLPDYPPTILDQTDHLEALTERMALVGKSVRAAIDIAGAIPDMGTADVFTEVSRAMDKDLWFVESHLHGSR